MTQRTPFYERHLQLGGKIVDFFGWELPVQYSTITLEHNAVRQKVGIFDISHMGQLLIWGEGAYDFLQHTITNDMKKAEIGKGIYAHLLNDKGGVIDDIFVYRLDEDQYLMIINASRREADSAWLLHQSKKFDVTILEAPFAAGFALQGPNAAALARKLNQDIPSLPRFGISEFKIGDVSAHVARTGYTGEDGFEFFAPAGHLMMIWDQIFSIGAEFGLLPCGLGARDTLRTEVSYPLYGHELDEDHTPLEAGLSWVVKLDKGAFIGRDALLKQKSEGLKTILRGFKVEAGGVARNGGVVSVDGKDVSTVASGTFAPTLGFAIGMAYMPASVPAEGAKITIRQGTRELQAVTTKMPFFKKQLVQA